MAVADSALDREALAYARGLLRAPLPRENLWAVLASALFCAAAALAFAFAMVIAPPAVTSHLALEPEVQAPEQAPAVTEAPPSQAAEKTTEKAVP